jgi:hypothetical protein
MMSFKQQLIEECNRYFDDKVNALRDIMLEITNSANNETKSSAGDKHETARAMMQLEQEKLSKQITDLAAQKNEFDKIDFSKTSQAIALGSLVETTKGSFLIAASIGKITVNDKVVFVISNQSPLGSEFSGKQKVDEITFNGVNYLIENIN